MKNSDTTYCSRTFAERKATLILTIVIAVTRSVLAQDVPPVYDVEHTGAKFADPCCRRWTSFRFSDLSPIRSSCRAGLVVPPNEADFLGRWVKTFRMLRVTISANSGSCGTLPQAWCSILFDNYLLSFPGLVEIDYAISLDNALLRTFEFNRLG